VWRRSGLPAVTAVRAQATDAPNAGSDGWQPPDVANDAADPRACDNHADGAAAERKPRRWCRNSVYDGRSHGTATVGSEKAALPPLDDEIKEDSFNSRKIAMRCWQT